MGKKQRRRREATSLEPLKQQLRSEGLLAGREVVFKEVDGDERMSEILVTLIEPYQEMTESYEAFQKLITLGAIAWNAALLPRKLRQELLNETIADLPDLDRETRREMRSLLAELIARKERLFPYNKRYIASYRVSETKNNYRVAVASTWEEPKEVSGREGSLSREEEAPSPSKPSRAAMLTCLALLVIGLLTVGFTIRWLVLAVLKLVGSTHTP